MKKLSIAFIILGVIMLVTAFFFMKKGYLFVFAVGILVLIGLNVYNLWVIKNKEKQDENNLTE